MKNNYSLSQLASIYCVYKDLSVTTRTVNCCTCGKSIQITSPEDSFSLFGHYIPRSVSRKLKYHPQNTHSQCSSCNLNTTLNIDNSYTNYMIYRYGENIKNELFTL